MIRELSKILILLLLVLSPVSYSSVEIPDFETQSPPTEVYRVKKAVAAIDSSLRPAASLPLARRERAVYNDVASPAPNTATPDDSRSGRAPPQ